MNKNTLIATIIAAALAVACGDDTARVHPVNNPGPSTSSVGPTLVASPEAPGANCPAGGVALSTPLGVDGASVFYVCNGTNGVNGVDGVNGTNGTNGVDGQPGATGPAGPAGGLSSQTSVPVGNETCPNGGVALTFTGAEAPVYVCNGAPGTNTTTVVQGPPGPKGDPGANGADGLPGAPGQPGANGTSSTTVTSVEPAGPNCTNGGLRLDVTNSDVTTTAYVCNGVNGTNGVDGAQGPAGPAGADGAPGTPGADGQPGAPGAPGADGSSGPVTTSSGPGANIDCIGTFGPNRRVSYQAHTYSDGLVLAFASVEENSNSTAGFGSFASNSPDLATAPVQVFATANADFFIVSADRVAKTLSVSVVSGGVVTPLVVSNVVCH